jgi:hypothetical protein
MNGVAETRQIDGMSAGIDLDLEFDVDVGW